MRKVDGVFLGLEKSFLTELPGTAKIAGKLVPFFYLAGMFFLLLPVVALSQNPPQESTISPELKRRAEEVKVLAEIAEAEKKIRDAKFPKPISPPPSGETKITGDKSFIETQMMGHISAACASKKVADSIYAFNTNVDTIFIYSETDVKTLSAYERTLSRIEIMQRRAYRLDDLWMTRSKASMFNTESPCPPAPEPTTVIPQPPGTFLPMAASLVGSTFDLLSYFRPNVEIKPETFEIEDKVMISEVFRNLRAKYGAGIKLYNLSSAPLSVSTPNFEESNLLKNLDKLFESKRRIESIIANIDSLIEQRQKKGECVKNKDEAKRSAMLLEIQQLNQFAAPYKSLIIQIDALIKELITDDTGTNANVLTDYLRLESTHPLMETFSQAIRRDKNSNPVEKLVYWLELKAIEAGGNTRIKSRSVIELFTGGNRIGHSGGSIIMYNLYDKTGRSVLSDTVVNYLKHRKPSRIENSPCE